MSKSNFKWVAILLILNGVMIEIDHSYKNAMDISNIVMPKAPIIHLPKVFHHSSLASIPVVHQFDLMTMTSGAVMFEQPSHEYFREIQ